MDQRSDHRNRIGTIRSHVGIPIRGVDSDLPVPQAVDGALSKPSFAVALRR